MPPHILDCHLQVTGVGINTEWGLLMASISEDTGEETPLQVPPAPSKTKKERLLLQLYRNENKDVKSVITFGDI